MSGTRVDESGEMWIVSTRTVGSCGQLTTSSEPVGHETFEENGLEIGPGQVDGGGVPCRSRADDDLKGKDKKSACESAGRDNVQLLSASSCSSRSFR